MERATCLLVVISCLIPAGSALLETGFNTPPPSYNWDAANTWAKDPLMTPMFNVFKAYKIPAATMGYRLNPTNTTVSLAAPQAGQWNSPESWWMAGFNMDYRSPMRVASVTKPLTVAVWATFLSGHNEAFFYTLWTTKVGPLPEPKDSRVKLIRIKHLLAHTSGFDNGLIGFDPAFTGKTVVAQTGDIVKSTMLLATPGVKYSYSNFGFMLLAQLAEALRGKDFTTQIRELFPSTVPVFGASDTTPVSAAAAGGAAEPSTYVVQPPDGIFAASVMKGNGNLVSNVATLSWFGTQYWMGGASAGRRITASNFASGYTYMMNGGMPGTMSFLIQWTTPKKLVSSICIIINTRISPANGQDAFYSAMNAAAATFLQEKFKNY